MFTIETRAATVRALFNYINMIIIIILLRSVFDSLI